MEFVRRPDTVRKPCWLTKIWVRKLWIRMREPFIRVNPYVQNKILIFQKKSTDLKGTTGAEQRGKRYYFGEKGTMGRSNGEVGRKNTEKVFLQVVRLPCFRLLSLVTPHPEPSGCFSFEPGQPGHCHQPCRLRLAQRGATLIW